MDFEIRMVRTVAQGPRKLSAERAEYFRLVTAGYSNKDACRIVGVNERTGREWRNGGGIRSGPGSRRIPSGQLLTPTDHSPTPGGHPFPKSGCPLSAKGRQPLPLCRPGIGAPP